MPTAVKPPTDIPSLSAKLLSPRRRQTQPESTEVPPTPALSSTPDLSNQHYSTPTRRILSETDHQLFLTSETHNLIVSFVFHLSDSVRDTTISAVRDSSAAQDPAILALFAVLDDAERILKECPALDTGSRFGNPAFRDFLSKINTTLPSWHSKFGVLSQPAVDEISTYLASAFGNGSRIDYGSGHELNFLLWLLCLRQAGFLPASTFPALALLVFPRYLTLMRSVQETYYLEPAGSHGVWGLDDYQFLPFLFGASQLVGHKHIRPMSIHNELIIEECSKDYLYLDQIRWVNATKTVQGLRWHSPMLDDISSAKNWGKVEAGMRKMFLKEVLGKLPVAQHFMFGSLLPPAEGMSGGEEGEAVGEAELVDADGMRHVHNPTSWGDCCGIKVPSAVGARREAGKRGEGEGLRRVPFD
ncbi:related to phosphotyrosyl phosphatase activator PTPA [Ramularia collo-cygni]|uniref:Serine/threonine-protein phosphatase 2A activator n=1 Tax=Ramularia collo-cygni TaxID=112498 RepID=A0A2D3VAJ1_9PEZI|nr:related to phosphotyrosyl phosphatase activator PTPA [Ramularia collo-cygni]CZT22645.1 related to phosphotyrosyl phosphatase activator PTPA [Ramularia collo-cygni]